MRRAGIALAMMLVIMLISSPGYAAGCPEGTVPQPVDRGGVICIPAVDPGAPGSGGGDGGTGGGGNAPVSGGPTEDICDPFLAVPQPPASDPGWQGHSPDDGDLYICVLPGTGNPVYRFVPSAADPPPDPAVMARKALDQLSLTVPTVNLAPTPPAKTYVGLETWLWMPASQWATLRKSVTAGSTTVTVLAVPKRVVWNMGAGTTQCFEAGRPWSSGKMPAGAQSSCKYVYQRVSDFQPDQKFKVSAVITFDVSWQCTGTCLAPEGTLGEVDGLPGGTAIRVGERQSVNTDPGGA